jgi:hypothetical protein
MLHHSEPNRAEPARWTWFSVETPSVFKEYKLPASEADWERTHKQCYRELETLAERTASPFIDRAICEDSLIKLLLRPRLFL